LTLNTNNDDEDYEANAVTTLKMSRKNNNVRIIEKGKKKDLLKYRKPLEGSNANSSENGADNISQNYQNTKINRDDSNDNSSTEKSQGVVQKISKTRNNEQKISILMNKYKEVNKRVVNLRNNSFR